VLVALVAAGLLVAVAAGPATAKMYLQATFDAPISFESPPGATLLVGITVLASGEDGELVPVRGSPVHLVLTGRDGATTRAAGVADREPGHYTMQIEVPAGGPRRAEVLLDGTTDLPMMLTASPFTFGPIGEGTAQLVPGKPAAAAPAAAPVPPRDPTTGPAGDPAAAPPAGDGGWLPAGVGLVAGLLALAGVAVLLQRTRGGAGARAGGARGG
jgi:hypothetical protein